MNIECDQAAIDELRENFRYNDAVIRNMILRVNRAVTEPSPISKEREGRPEIDNHSSDHFERNKHDQASKKTEPEDFSESDKSS